MSDIKVRFAPSPTGPLHIGGARSALFNYLYARHLGGTFLVRTEDTDTERSRKEYEEEILQSLKWLGMSWDEGVQVGGPGGPYRQMERLEIYQRYARQLLEAGQAYYCFCTEEDLEAERQALLAKGEMVRYLGRCRHLSPRQVQDKLEAGLKPALRFKVEAGEDVLVDDLVRGKVAFPRDNMGDFIIMKSDGIPTYNFAVVVDDHLMGVTDVIRAEEHLSNTPRQILIYEALGWKAPRFAHISLILGADRQKMSKRHGATSVIAYQDQGYLPEAIVNFLALLGWSPEGEKELFTLGELEEAFTLERVGRSPAVFDIDKLNHINREHLKRKSDQELAGLLRPYLEKSHCGPALTHLDERRYLFLVRGIRDYLTCLAEAPDYAAPFLTRPPLTPEAREVLAAPEVWPVLEELARDLPSDLTPEIAKTWIKDFIKSRKLAAKQVYMPLRCAITGLPHGPELPYLLAVMGSEEATIRIKEAKREVLD